MNDAWDESYGLNGGGDNIPLTVAGDTPVRVVFDDNLKRVGLEADRPRAAPTTRHPMPRSSPTPCASPAATSSSTSS